MNKALNEFERLIDIMNTLREKCPWDRKQTFDSLRYLTIEEVYELSEGILDKDYESIKNELGDILLHVVFYAKLLEEANFCTIAEVLESINNKLIERHPHVFSDTKVKNEQEVKENWEKIKVRKNKKNVLSGVPEGLPSIIKAYRIQEKARGVGFEWEKISDVFLKVQEELQEFQEVYLNNTETEKIEEEFGDLLFSLINLGRFLNLNADNALEKTNRKFIKRFNEMEKIAEEKGLNITNLSLEEMDNLWNEIKINEKK